MFQKKITKRMLYPAFEFYMKRRTLSCLDEIEKSQMLTAQEIEELQLNKIKSILKYSAMNVPYYTNLFKKYSINKIRGPEDIARLPTLNKDIIKNNKYHIISSLYREKNLSPNSTGGSTGENLSFFNDKLSSGKLAAYVLRNDRWAGLDIGDKSAKLWGSSFDISKYGIIRKYLYNNLFNILILSSYDLSPKKMETYFYKLKLFKPDVLISYPSPLYYLAKFWVTNLKLNLSDLNLKSIICSAEVLYPFQREFIESTFNCRIYNRYGCREFGPIAQECFKHRGLHLNAEHVYLEILNKHGELAKPGELGEIVVTDLDNYGMPFIRYKIGDIGALSDRACDCGMGLPILEKLEGRTFDVTIGSNGVALGGTFWTLLLRTYIEGIIQFQVIQESINYIKINLKTSEKFNPKSIKILTSKIKSFLGEDMDIEFQVVDEIPLTKSGKSRFVISKLPPSTENLFIP